MGDKVVAVVQARMGSTRLPGKVLKKINGEPMIKYTLDSLKRSKYIDEVVLATSDLKKDKPLAEFANEYNFNLFRGSEEDVLARYYHAAKEYNADVVVRITGDCPLIDYQITDNVIKLYLDNKNEVDFVANNIKRTFPRGVDTSVISSETLKIAYKNAELKAEREHVVLYIKKTHEEDFNLLNYKAKGKYNRPDIRITVDEKEDLELVREIISRIESRPITLEKVINILDNNPDLLKINANINQKKINL